MSEYQYYEFVAIDRPLTAGEMSGLRSLSSRAEITKTHFRNVYNWGDFRGSPETMLEKYFDAHVYVSNFGYFRLMLRFPHGVVPEDVLNQYAPVDSEEGLSYRSTKEHLIVSWVRNDEGGGDWVDGEGWMGQLIPIREEIERGDYRALYIGWLASVKYLLTGDWEEDEYEDITEPPVPPGLGSLTAAQHALVDFLDISEDTLKAASLANPATPGDEDADKHMAEWVATIAESEVREYLLMVLRGDSRKAERLVRSRYHEFVRLHAGAKSADASKRRTLSELRGLTAEAREQRRKQEALELKRKEAERERKRRQYLKEMAGSFSDWWEKAHANAEEQSASAYDRAKNILVDLRDAYAQEGRQTEFLDLLRSFTSRHARRQALMRRLKEVGLQSG